MSVKADSIAKLTNGNWSKGSDYPVEAHVKKDLVYDFGNLIGTMLLAPINSESRVGTTKIISGVR